MWLTDQQTQSTNVIYATQQGQNMNGLTMKVIVTYPGFATNLETLTAQTPAVPVILLKTQQLGHQTQIYASLMIHAIVMAKRSQTRIVMFANRIYQEPAGQ